VPTFDDDSDKHQQPPGWEPEPLELPLHRPPPPARPPQERRRDEESGEVESPGLVVIDLC
jgi:hypothetical protein